MVRLMLLCFAGMWALQVNGQTLAESQVPATAVASFKKSFPAASARWQKGPQSSFEALFLVEGKERAYVYDAQGLLQFKKVKATLAELPATVQTSVKSSYPSQKADGYKVISRTEEKYYEVYVASGQQQDRLKYDLTGKQVGKTTVALAEPGPSVLGPAPKPSPTTVSAQPTPATTPAKPAPVATPVSAKPTPVVATAPAKPAPAVAASPAKPAPAMAMRGESASTSAKPKPADADLEDDLEDDLLDDMDEDMEDLDLDEDIDATDIEDDDWEDVELDEEDDDDDLR